MLGQLSERKLVFYISPFGIIELTCNISVI